MYAVVDQLVSARPWEGGHWWVCPILPIVYVIFNVAFWAAGGTNDVRHNFKISYIKFKRYDKRTYIYMLILGYTLIYDLKFNNSFGDSRFY